MTYTDRTQAEFELDQNRRELPMYRWTITEYDTKDGTRLYTCRKDTSAFAAMPDKID